MLSVNNEIKITGAVDADTQDVLTDAALNFLLQLHRTFDPVRLQLLQARTIRQREFNEGMLPALLAHTSHIRDSDWRVAFTPQDLQQRWVEITGPVDRKMMINALNSGADTFMADFEDSLSPTWSNITQGQKNLKDAVRRTIEFKNPDGKVYALKDDVATLLVRPRGWHLNEERVHADGVPMSASLFDFGLYFFHNAHELITRGSGPYFYLPKMESHLEARLWNDVFNMAQDLLDIPRGTIRATVLIETILAAFEMDEILYELRDHAAGLNAGRWDYIFSVIKKFSHNKEFILPDRSQVVMTVPFMRAYTELLIRTCHRRGAHAIGGMAAFIPSRRDEQVNEHALNKVREDKLRESNDGCDGTWVAHPDLVPHARKIFQEHLGGKPDQRDVLREDVSVAEHELLNIRVPDGKITENGLRANINIALQYLNSWLNGNGAAAINNLMEDTATAEISRAQLWQWVHHNASLDDGRIITSALYEQVRTDELETLSAQNKGRYHEAAEILDTLVLNDDFVEFLTILAMKYI